MLLALLLTLSTTPAPAPSAGVSEHVSDGGEISETLTPTPEEEHEELEDGGTLEGVIESDELGENEGNLDGGIKYTADLTDAKLEKLWRENPEALGSVSFGVVNNGRLFNGVPFPAGDGWTVISEEQAWGTQETITQLLSAIRSFRGQFPDAPPIHISTISVREGGWLKPHTTHQNGRDADLGFVYPTWDQPRTPARERVMDVGRTWALMKEVITRCDVQYILLDTRVQRVLYNWALKHHEDKAWLESLFHAGYASVFQYARHHRDHFHVRLYNPRAQELGRRLTPLLARWPDQSVTFYQVQPNDTLGHIAALNGTQIWRIRRANKLTTDRLAPGKVLQIPLHRPCTKCPVPPTVEAAPRHLPKGWVEPVAAPMPCGPTETSPPEPFEPWTPVF